MFFIVCGLYFNDYPYFNEKQEEPIGCVPTCAWNIGGLPNNAIGVCGLNFSCDTSRSSPTAGGELRTSGVLRIVRVGKLFPPLFR